MENVIKTYMQDTQPTNNIPSGQKLPIAGESLTEKQPEGQNASFDANIKPNLGKRPATGKPFVKGDPRIKSGRIKGSTNFKTDFYKAIKQIKNSETGKSVQVQDMIRLALEQMFKRMLKGDPRFDKIYLDTMDRYYGKTTTNIDHTTGGEKLPVAPIIGMRIIKDEDEENKS